MEVESAREAQNLIMLNLWSNPSTQDSRKAAGRPAAFPAERSPRAAWPFYQREQEPSALPEQPPTPRHSQNNLETEQMDTNQEMPGSWACSCFFKMLLWEKLYICNKSESGERKITTPWRKERDLTFCHRPISGKLSNLEICRYKHVKILLLGH